MTKYKEMEEPGKLTLMTILVHKQNKMRYSTKTNTPLMLRASFLNKMLRWKVKRLGDRVAIVASQRCPGFISR